MGCTHERTGYAAVSRQSTVTTVDVTCYVCDQVKRVVIGHTPDLQAVAESQAFRNAFLERDPGQQYEFVIADGVYCFGRTLEDARRNAEAMMQPNADNVFICGVLDANEYLNEFPEVL